MADGEDLGLLVSNINNQAGIHSCRIDGSRIWKDKVDVLRAERFEATVAYRFCKQAGGVKWF